MAIQLSPAHERMLIAGSGIDRTIADERGYFTATTKQRAVDLGFSRFQARVGLVIPIHGLGGTLVGRQLRPDQPRESKGKLVKYETPKGARAKPDIHPRMQRHLLDPETTLYITEGIKKGDAAASRGVACIALTGGVWGFKTQGGGVHTELKDFVRWQGPQGQPRQVVIAFDSDCVTKQGVHQAMERLASLISNFGGEPRFLLLPPGADGKKQGLDDFFVAGGTVEQLEKLTVDELPQFAGELDRSRRCESNSPADQLVHLVRSNPNVELFHAPGDAERGYATIRKDGRARSYDVESVGFQGWLTKTYLDAYSRAPSNDARANAVNTLKAIAIHGDLEHPVARRVGEHQGEWLLDLGDDTWDLVRISEGGFSIVSSSPVRFLRTAAMRPLPRPVPGGHIDDLWEFLNVPDDPQRLLILTWIVSAMRPRGPYPILAFQGQQGSAKSFATSIVRRLVDPNKAGLRRPPKTAEDLMVSAGCNHLLAFENLSSLPEWMSDTMCMLATGGGFAARQLYTNAEEAVIQACCPQILNGIPNLATRGDFAERCVTVQLPRIDPKTRKSASELEERFAEIQPRLLGALLDLAARANQLLPNIQLVAMPRMADFARLGVAVEQACGWPEGSFLAAYDGNASEMSMLALESGLGSALLPVVERGIGEDPDQLWNVSMKDLLKEIRDSAEDDRDRKRWLPTNERKLRVELDRLAPSLRVAGLLVTYPERTRDGARVCFERTDDAQPDSTHAPPAEPRTTLKRRDAPTTTPASLTKPVSELLLQLKANGALLRFVDGQQQIAIEGSTSNLCDALATTAEARHDEILQHLANSPGANIIDYPDSMRLHTHEFQELLISEQTKMRKLIEIDLDGEPRLRWFESDLTPERVAEIAHELGLDR